MVGNGRWFGRPHPIVSMNQQTEQRICLYHQRKPDGVFPGCGCYGQSKQSDPFKVSGREDLIIFDEASDVPKEVWDI